MFQSHPCRPHGNSLSLFLVPGITSFSVAAGSALLGAALPITGPLVPEEPRAGVCAPRHAQQASPAPQLLSEAKPCWTSSTGPPGQAQAQVTTFHPPGGSAHSRGEPCRSEGHWGGRSLRSAARTAAGWVTHHLPRHHTLPPLQGWMACHPGLRPHPFTRRRLVSLAASQVQAVAETPGLHRDLGTASQGQCWRLWDQPRVVAV